MKEKVLQVVALSSYLDPILDKEFNVIKYWELENKYEFLKKQGGEITGLVTAAPVGVEDILFYLLPNLKVISCRGVGLEKINLELAKEKKVRVAGTFGVLSNCVADLAFGLLLDVARNISTADRYIRQGKWKEKSYPLTTSVSNKKLGIVGLGEIGSIVAKRAQGFDMSVGYCSIHKKSHSNLEFFETVEELAAWCDFLMLTLSGNKKNTKLISKSVLKNLGPKGYLINVSRGTVVDEEILTEFLVNKKIAGAALDVYENEPLVPAELLSLENVVLTPHLGSSTEETRRKMENLVFENIKSFYVTGDVLTPAN